MTDRPTFSAQDLAECARREVRQRQRVYARLVAEGRMKPATADREIAMMEAIAAHFSGQGDLFGPEHRGE